MTLQMKKIRGGLTALLSGILSVLFLPPLPAEDWDTVPERLHSEYQAIAYHSSSGNWVSAYTGGFPLRLRGVVLNANEDWLDPTAAYDPEYHLMNLGGEAEIIVQSVDPADFGGTYCWMGQNYGNYPIRHDIVYNYTDPQWYAELNRLRLWHPEGYGIAPRPPEQLVRPGDYVEIRARAGLEYNGKKNVNEEHYNDPDFDFEVVVLQRGRGWDPPANLTLSDLKNPDDSFIFDGADRVTGAEHYQGMLVTLQNVHSLSGAWGPDQDVVVADDTGRTFNLHLSLGTGFSAFGPPGGTFQVTGIMNQDSSSGDAGYYLAVMDSGNLFQRWSTGSGLWSNPSNWGGSAPVTGGGMHFSGPAGGTATNNLSTGWAVGEIVFEAGAGPFTLDGNPITLTGDLVSFSPQAQTVAMDLTLAEGVNTIYAAAGDILIQNPLSNDAYLRKLGLGTVVLTGGIQGAGSLDVTYGVLETSSLVQNQLTIGAGSKVVICPGGGQTSTPNPMQVPEPATWIMLLAALLIGRRAVRSKKKTIAKP
jgi:hypothetical protein